MSDDCRKCCDMVKAADQCPHARAIEVESVECEHCGIHGQLADVIGAAHGECVGKFVDHEFVADRIADAVLSSGLVVPARGDGWLRAAEAAARSAYKAYRERDAALAAVGRVRAAIDRGVAGVDLMPTTPAKVTQQWLFDYLASVDRHWRDRMTAALDTTPCA